MSEQFNASNVIDNIVQLMYAKSKASNAPFNVARFNEFQKDIVLQMFDAYLEDKHIILDAPTGAGKSVIAVVYAMLIESYTNCDNTSYILTTDKMLQHQYETFVKAFMQAGNHIMLKGRANYKCIINDETFNDGACVQAGLSINETKKQYDCASRCGYIVTRDNAIVAQHTYLNYAYWLLQMQSQRVFNVRTITIFDEAHKMTNILSSAYTPKLNFAQSLISLLRMLNNELHVYLDDDVIQDSIAQIHSILKYIQQQLQQVTTMSA